jgi:hypothetical protein
MRFFRVVLLSISVVTSLIATAQNRIGVDMGAGWCYLKNGEYTPGHYKFATDGDITLGVHYQRRMNKNIYIGGRVMFQQYTFSYTYDVVDSALRNGGEVANKSSYLFVAPTIDYGFGERQIVHVFLSYAYGMLLRGSQNNHTYTYNYNGNFYDNSFRTDGEVSKTITRWDIGLSQHIPISPDWYATVTESYGMLSNALTQVDNPLTSGLTLKPGYFSITVGFAYKLLYTGWGARWDDE